VLSCSFMTVFVSAKCGPGRLRCQPFYKEASESATRPSSSHYFLVSSLPVGSQVEALVPQTKAALLTTELWLGRAGHCIAQASRAELIEGYTC
jgi:hypothetical protein